MSEQADLAARLRALADELERLDDQIDSGLSPEDPLHSHSSLPPGRQLAVARARKGLTQQQLADKSGISVNAIVNFENGRTKPRDRTLMSLAEVVDLDWEDLA